ncbi:YitT family protein [Caldibacillus lycopersici]|uniref:YitT family protein n=1 Tax=Perspicuibacillus lycopersici TaxID=1325689 RepID=A0AAE3IWP1_9BACI|nr:YitT family protein [Perspicuibacillus lycopersici]MCU9614973.1 YitT family protein [Perspicuibacillus lycopersici]
MEMTATAKKDSSVLLDIPFMILGTFMSAFGLNMLTIPAGMLSGGLTGISQIINHFFPVNVAFFYFVLNIPLLILGFIHLGKKFSAYTIFSTVLVSIFLYVLPIQHFWTDNILLSAIFGGVFNALGCGLVLRRGGSQGGLDILSRVISKYKNITVGKSNLIINGIIVVISGFIYGSEIALYTIVYLFVNMKTYNIILNHVDRISLLIVTEKGEAVSNAITHEMHRGTTIWNASGGYTHHEKSVLYCVIMKGEMHQFKKIVKSVDPSSFVSIISTQNVIGRFHQIW